MREYQFKAAWALTHKNSMVCFPTGTGKTLIAAVVMYNFYRWFPKVRIAREHVLGLGSAIQG